MGILQRAHPMHPQLQRQRPLLSGKRGYRIEFEDDVKKAINSLARDLIDKKEQVKVTERICAICRQLREGEGGCAEPVPKQ